MSENKDPKDHTMPTLIQNGKIDGDVPKVLVSEPNSPVDTPAKVNGVDADHPVVTDGSKTPEGRYLRIKPNLMPNN